jgi:hypothetical protein
VLLVDWQYNVPGGILIALISFHVFCILYFPNSIAFHCSDAQEYCNAKIKELQEALLPCPCPQARETQAQESKDFKAFFRGGIK